MRWVARLGLGALALVGGCVVVEPFPDVAPCDACAAIHARSSRCDAAGKCLLECDPGFADCNGRGIDGCESATSEDPSNCGACGKRCAPIHAVAKCVAAKCELGCFPENQRDCDQDPANGCETDLTRDRNNCGACGRACEGECAGVCQPFTLVEGLSAPAEIAVGDSYVYWPYPEGGGGIAKVPIHGGQSTALAQSGGGGTPRSLALSPSDLYWYDPGAKTIFRTALPEGGVAKPVIGAQTVAAIAADATGVFWSESAANEIRALDGTSYRTVAASPSDGVGQLLLDADAVYFIGPATKKVFRVPRAGGAPTPILTEPVLALDAIAIDDRTLYAAIGDTSGGRLLSVEKDGSGLASLFIIARTTGLATDGARLFYADTSSGQVFASLSTGAGGALIVAANQASPRAVALDRASVYWATKTSIVKVEKTR